MRQTTVSKIESVNIKSSKAHNKDVDKTNTSGQRLSYLLDLFDMPEPIRKSSTKLHSFLSEHDSSTFNSVSYFSVRSWIEEDVRPSLKKAISLVELVMKQSDISCNPEELANWWLYGTHTVPYILEGSIAWRVDEFRCESITGSFKKTIINEIIKEFGHMLDTGAIGQPVNTLDVINSTAEELSEFISFGMSPYKNSKGQEVQSKLIQLLLSDLLNKK